MLKILDKIVFLVSLSAIAGLLGAYTSSHINPNTFVWASLLGLAYPYLLITSILLLFYWIIRWKKMSWVMLVALLLGIPAFMTYYGTARLTESQLQSDFSLLSYNTRYFDLYGWSHEKNTKEKLLRYLNQFKGDVICLQEFATHTQNEDGKFLTSQLKSYPYHHIRKDMAIFSRIPLLNCGHVSFPSPSGSCIYCDLVLGSDTIRLYSVHLESYKLGKKERRFMQQISQGVKSEDLQNEVKNLTTRLTTANKNRAHQAQLLKYHLRQSPYPVILCGDFNDTPLSFTYREIKKGLVDSFIRKGRGIGNTYIGEFPSFRIDYILHTPDIETLYYQRDTIQLSDHYPIQGSFKMKKTP